MSREQEIRDAVDFARRKVPSLAAGYADTMIASSRTVEEVKADLFGKITARSPQDVSRASMLNEITRSGIDPKARAGIGSTSEPASQQIDGRAMARASMAKLLRKTGREPAA